MARMEFVTAFLQIFGPADCEAVSRSSHIADQRAIGKSPIGRSRQLGRQLQLMKISSAGWAGYPASSAAVEANGDGGSGGATAGADGAVCAAALRSWSR